MEIITNSEAETINEGKKLAQLLKPGAVVALFGNMGAGKTVFTRGLADGLGIKMNVSSPTFTIVNEYLGQTPLFHFDMYRLENENELYDIGWDDYLERNGVCVVEWSEKVPNAFPIDVIKIKLTDIGENRRSIVICRKDDGLC